MPQRLCRPIGAALVQRLVALVRYRCGDIGDRDPAEREVKENGCSSQTERAERVVEQQKGSVRCRASQKNARSMHKMQMQMALGRTREGKKSSSWCWLQLFSAAGLVGRGTPLPAFCFAGWLSRPSGHHGHWARTGALAWTGGVRLGPSKRRKVRARVVFCRPALFSCRRLFVLDKPKSLSNLPCLRRSYNYVK